MKLNQRIDALVALGTEISSKPEWLNEAVSKAYFANKWFTEKSSWTSLEAIADQFLNKDLLESWVAKYEFNDQVQSKIVGLVLAGNIPLVGFHDIMCSFISGHTTMAKLSSKDSILLSAIRNYLVEYDQTIEERIIITEKLKGFDAIIATGSNNSSTYFKEYFGKYPHIIRQNRNAVAVLSGNESEEDFKKLGQDIFTYFGLGCRNVSKVYVPTGYKFDGMLSVLHDHYKELANHDKYRNNFDYNNALFMLNKIQFLMNGSLIVTESDQIPSRISTIHYSYYNSNEQLKSELASKSEQIQCVVGDIELTDIPTFSFGEAQKPLISDYADGVDTMMFLKSL